MTMLVSVTQKNVSGSKETRTTDKTHSVRIQTAEGMFEITADKNGGIKVKPLGAGREIEVTSMSYLRSINLKTVNQT